MKKTWLYVVFLLVFGGNVELASADSCTVNFSISDYGTIYDYIRYTFIPLSSIDPLHNGGGQFSLRLNGFWYASNPVSWGGEVSVPLSKKVDCDVLVKRGTLENVEVSYADLSGKMKDAGPSAQHYCLLPNVIGIADGSESIVVPQFGPNNGYWRMCGC